MTGNARAVNYDEALDAIAASIGSTSTCRLLVQGELLLKGFSGSEKTKMARVTVEDCLELEDNRFALVILASARARKLIKGATPTVTCDNKPNVTSLREIAAGKVHFDRPSHTAIEEWIAKAPAPKDKVWTGETRTTTVQGARGVK